MSDEKKTERDPDLMGSDGLADMTGKLFGDIPEGKCCMAVMGKAGDSKFMWDPRNSVETDIARETYEAYRARGYMAFRVEGKEGDTGEQMLEFDPEAGRIIFCPPMAGG